MALMLKKFVQKAREGYIKRLYLKAQEQEERLPQLQQQVQVQPPVKQIVQIQPIPISIRPIVTPVRVPFNVPVQVQTQNVSMQQPYPQQIQQQPQQFQPQFSVQPFQQSPQQPQQSPQQTHDQLQEEQELSFSKYKPRRLTFAGIVIPKVLPPDRAPIGKFEISPETQPIQLSYPLIPKKPAKGEKVYAYSVISWEPKLNKYVYKVVEPHMSARIKDIMMKVKELLEQKLDIDFSQMRTFEAKQYIRKQVDEIIGYYGFKLSDEEKDILHYYLERDFIGLGRIEPLMQDEQIEDISCDGLNIPMFVFHRSPVIASVMTNVFFRDAEELDSFVIHLAQLSGKSLSVATPLLGGSLPDGSRVQATLATDIARRGSNFTIRKFTEKPLTPIHLLNYGTLDVKTLAFLWLAVDYGKSIIVSGGTASGKTSLLNVLSLFIRPEKKIVSIEDTPELKLPHPHWVPQVARSAIEIEEGRKYGEIDLFDLLKESLRQRPDYIIVGEVRGKEAYVLFQEMATGHPSLATIHAENMPKLIDRLTSPPISLPPTLITSANIIVFLVGTRYRDKQVRRVNEVLEVIGIDEQTKQPITNQVFKWNPINDSFEVESNSIVLKEIAMQAGMSDKQIIEELERRMVVLTWMQKRNLTEYIDVNAVVNIYYSYPERVISSIEGSMR